MYILSCILPLSSLLSSMCGCAYVIYHKLQNKKTSEKWRNAGYTGNRIDRNSGAVFFKARFWGDILATGAFLFGIPK